MTNNQPNLIVDNNPVMGYETNGLLRRVFNFFFIPVLNSIPSNFQKVIKSTHKSAECIIENATSHVAIEVLYKHGNPKDSKNLLHKIFHKIWFNMNNSKAVRDRLKLVEREIRIILLKLAEEKKDINILSIASGSARAIVESVCSLDKLNNINVFVTFLDKNPKAIEYSKILSKKIPPYYNLRWITDTASNFPKYFNEEHKNLNIIEMVGLLDYFDDDKVIKIFSLIYQNLSHGGFLVSANIDNNKEKKFITNVVGWKMIYRNGEQLVSLAIKSGFDSKKIKIIYEPLKIHAVLVAQK